MIDLIVAVILLLMALAGIVARKTYFYLPLLELKRRAARHDPLAAQLYRAVAYGNSLRGLLWLYIGLISACSLVLLARLLPIWASLLIVGPLLWIAFSLIPSTRVTKLGAGLTKLVTPCIAWLLNYFHPLISRGADVVERRYVTSDHTGLFERGDLLELLERQQHQADNRLSEEELEIAGRALRFEDHKVGDIMTARKQTKTILAKDTIGPILIDEIHKSGQSSVLVRETKKGPIAGWFSASQLNLDSQGTAQDIMDKNVYYLHESDSLSQALHAFFETNQPLFVVVNSFEEYVGLITVKDIVKQLLGHVPGDDFDQYTDLAAVATHHHHARPAKQPETIKSEKTEKTDETPVKTDDEVVE